MRCMLHFTHSGPYFGVRDVAAVQSWCLVRLGLRRRSKSGREESKAENKNVKEGIKQAEKEREGRKTRQKRETK